MPAALTRLVALALGVGLLVTVVPRARAEEFHVRSPIVEPGEAELEVRGAEEWSRGQRASREDTAVLAAGYGVTERWFTELELEWERPPGGRLQRTAAAWENVVQLTPQGRYWLDAGLYAAVEAAAQRDQPDVLAVGPLLQKQVGRLLATLNLIAERQAGSHADGVVRGTYAWQARWLIHEPLEPGLEGFGEPHEQRAGPVLFGTLPVGHASRLRYELGYLAGLTRDTPDHTLKAALELEF